MDHTATDVHAIHGQYPDLSPFQNFNRTGQTITF